MLVRVVMSMRVLVPMLGLSHGLVLVRRFVVGAARGVVHAAILSLVRP